MQIAKAENKTELLFPVISFVSMFLAVVFLIFGREYYHGGVESDYLGSFLEEAARLLNGEAMVMHHHPPLYPIIVTAGLLLTSNDFALGLFLAGASGLLAAVCNYIFFLRLSGPYAAWGSNLALGTSWAFFFYSASVSSNVLYWGLASLCLLLSLIAYENHSKRVWAACGVVLALCLLTRANALPYSLVFILPLFQSCRWSQRIQCAVVLAAAFAVPMLAWITYAHQTGTPYFTTNTYVNLAMTYYSTGADRLTLEGYGAVMGEFDSVWDVFARDPGHIARTYAADLGSVVIKSLKMIFPPVTLLALFGMIAWVKNASKPYLYFYLLLILGQILLLNFKASEYRYYLFLLPLAGAMAGCGIHELGRKWTLLAGRKGKSMVFLVLFAAGLLCAFGLTYFKFQGAFNRELKEAVPQVREVVDPGSVIMTRKPHLPYYAKSTGMAFPGGHSFDELFKVLSEKQAADRSKRIFVYYGVFERMKKKDFSYLMHPGQQPVWLIPVAQGKEQPSWILFLFEPEPGPVSSGANNGML